MCGFGMDTIFKVAIAIVVILVILALLRAAFGEFWNSVYTLPYWNVIQIVIGGVIAILILLFIWRLAQCAGIVGHYGDLSPFQWRAFV